MMTEDLLKIFQALNDVEDIRDEYLRAPFGYVGGKSRTFKKILPFLPYRKSFIEVFGGSGIVILNRRSSQLDVFNDRYAGVVAFYRCLKDKDKFDQLVARLTLTIHAREEFIWCRDTWKDCQDDIERAARWYYMLQTSFINKGQVWARAINPSGMTAQGTAFNIRDKLVHFQAIHDRFKNIQVDNQDWRQCMRDYDNPNAVFYLDPPYLYGAQGPYIHNFTKQDHINLLETIMQTDGFCALSGYPNKLYDSYDWDDRYEWENLVTARSFAYTDTNNLRGHEGSEKRETVTEILWIKE